MFGGIQILIINNTNLKKGDIVTEKEIGYSSETQDYTNEYIKKFIITRVNKNTYTCEYTEGYLTGCGFKWIKDADLTKYSKKKYYK